MFSGHRGSMTDHMPSPRSEYPPGVPCLVDTEQPDPGAAAEFYGGLFGWHFEDKLPPGSEDRYLVASLGGLSVAAIASPTPGIDGPPAWNTYVSVLDADTSAVRAAELGATVVVAPINAGPPGAVAGRWAALVDPEGAAIRIWQPGYRHGAQVVNSPGSWNSSDLATGDVAAATAFYGTLFGWEASDIGDGAYMWRRPGYGDFLAIGDPGIRERHSGPWVPEGFSDAIGWMSVGGPARWTVTFTVDDTDAAAERAVALGGTVIQAPTDAFGGVVRTATLRDPQGAELTVGTYDPSKITDL
jgi:predicted enzyme related to lactoylglutathione lyase